MEMSKLLNTGLDADTLALCVRLCEHGVNPEALALVIQELRRESTAVKVRKHLLYTYILFDLLIFWRILLLLTVVHGFVCVCVCVCCKMLDSF